MPPPPTPQDIAQEIGIALIAGLVVAAKVEELYTALGAFDVPKTWVGAGPTAGYALTVRPGWGLLNAVSDYVILSEVQ